MTKNITLYKRKDSPYWWGYFKHPVTGEFVKKSSKEREREKAEEAILALYDKCLKSTGKIPVSLEEVMESYEDPDTNPRYIQAQKDGYNYGYEHATHVASSVSLVHSLMKKHAPQILAMDIKDISSLEIKTIKNIIIQEKGNRCTASKNFENFKTIFSQAHEDGLVNQNVANGTRNIKYKKKERFAVDASDLADIISLKEKYASMGLLEAWAFFTIAATTGMRRGEIMALNTEQISDNVIHIDRAIKITGKNKEEIGTPKWDYTRTIPVSNITLDAISTLTPSKNGRLFDKECRWANKIFGRLMITASCMFPDRSFLWEKITAHILRHSLTSNLYVAGIPSSLIRSYLGWEHGLDGIVGTQRHYTHIYARNLYPVPKLVDKLYEPCLEKRINLVSLQCNKLLLSDICEGL